MATRLKFIDFGDLPVFAMEKLCRDLHAQVDSMVVPTERICLNHLSSDGLFQKEVAVEGETGEREEEQLDDPLETVERALEEALELLLAGDEASIVSEPDSVTTANRLAAEQSLRDELARADDDSGLLFSNRHDDEETGWWLELKPHVSMSETMTTEASSSSTWYSEKTTSPNTNASPQAHWARLLKACQFGAQRLDLTVASNLLAVSWNAKCRQQRPTILWTAWKHVLAERLQPDALMKLCRKDTFHVSVLAVPVMGSFVHEGWHRSLALLSDNWGSYTRNETLAGIDEIE